MLTGYPQEEMQADCQKEVDGGMEREKEQKLRERLKAGYEAYIQQLKEKPVPDLIEMATEISAVQFVYTELSLEGRYTEYLDYLQQLENPLEVVSNDWLDYESHDYHEDMQFLLQDKVDRWIEDGCPAIEEPAETPSLEQGVAMC